MLQVPSLPACVSSPRLPVRPSAANPQPQFGKRYRSADQRQGDAIFGFLLGVLGLVALVVSGGAKWGHNRLLDNSASRQAVVASVETFQEAKDRPSLGKNEFNTLMEVVQTELGRSSQVADVQVVAKLVPALTEADQQAVKTLLAQARTADTIEEVKPLFSQWLNILEKHGDGKFDKALVQAQADAFFENVESNQSHQNVLFYAVVVSALMTFGGFGMAFRAVPK